MKTNSADAPFRIRSFTADRLPKKRGSKPLYTFNGKELLAEELAIEAYRGEGHLAVWSENGLWNMITALLFWDVVFARHPDVHISHDMPNDLFLPQFYERRRELVDNRIAELRSKDLIQKLSSEHARHAGSPCRLVYNWESYSLDELVAVASKADPLVVLRICERILKDHNNYRSGLPDLVVFSDEAFFFSEVKSETDKLRDSQLGWCSFITDTLGLPVDLFLINPTEKKIDSLMKAASPRSTDVYIEFGWSTSKKRASAIEHISSQPSFKSEGDGKSAVYSATFSTADVENLFTMMDLTTGWKSRKIRIGNSELSSGDVRDALWCCREKQKERASLDWCNPDANCDSIEGVACKNVDLYTLLHNCGHVDTEHGEWVFSKDLVSMHIRDTIERYGLCPFFPAQDFSRSVERLMPSIDPRQDQRWAFISSTNEQWIWHEGSWIGNYSRDFPGYAMMVRVEPIDREDRQRIIDYKKDREQANQEQFSLDVTQMLETAVSRLGSEQNEEDERFETAGCSWERKPVQRICETRKSVDPSMYALSIFIILAIVVTIVAVLASL